MIFEIKKTDRLSKRVSTFKPDGGSYETESSYVTIDDEQWFQIEDSHLMPEFFTMPVSADDHWMFISNSGAVTAGRRDADNALFPYYPCDKLGDFADTSGPVTVVRLKQPDGSTVVWRPFAAGVIGSGIRRNVYKNVPGSRLLLEEINEDLSLLFRYQWAFSKAFGFVRTCELVNLSAAPVAVSLIDGIQNVLPYGVSKAFQLQYSNLADAYKKCELLAPVGLGLFYLSSIPTDRAEPSEGLRATVAWQFGLNDPKTLLSTKQLEQFISTGQVSGENNTRGRRGAYLVQADLELDGLASTDWSIVANLEQDSADVARLSQQIRSDGDLSKRVGDDVEANQRKLLDLTSSADGRQSGSGQRRTHRHQSNVIYNVMRGGLPADNYQIEMRDFLINLAVRNKAVYLRHKAWLESLGEKLSLSVLLTQLQETADADLLRLGREYLPLTFSRRHGDPSRPWNRFSIDLTNEDGTQKLGYQGNWRDIFQNWEGVAVSWPRYTNSMIRRFVNCSTADGYNPYRITHEGVDWEAPGEEEFSNIGYWGDHQIVYLLKLMEWSRQIDPSEFKRLLLESGCTYANVPYQIVSYQQMLVDPYETIVYDHQLAKQIDDQVEIAGSDGKLVHRADGTIQHASMLEKLLVPALAKMTNFVPDGGIWLNTQRPEWNDANNALVGNGMSVVTTCYLRRYLAFLCEWFRDFGDETGFKVSAGIWGLAMEIQQILTRSEAGLQPNLDQQEAGRLRREVVDGLSQAGSDYRTGLYENGLGEAQQTVRLDQCIDLFETCLTYLDACVASNRRDDGLYHAYNLLKRDDETIQIEHLAEMLEGQVAAISSGSLTADQTCDVLDALRNSRMYRADQDSYTLYPDRELPGFMEKNLIAKDWVLESELLLALVNDQNESVVKKDVHGDAHFNADFRNVSQLEEALNALRANEKYVALVDSDRELVADIYERTFKHRRFTGRSENFFAYEGLGSIYWHMVSKLALATLEQCVAAVESSSGDVSQQTIKKLKRHYIDIREGLGLNKTPAHFGAFPTDPYSHTPRDAGAKQPGMTGQVKEDVLCRMIELGARVRSGCVSFEPVFFDANELHQTNEFFEFVGLDKKLTQLPLESGTFAWTWCQIPVVYHRSSEQRVEVCCDGEVVKRDELSLTQKETAELFDRSGKLTRIDVYFDPQAWNPAD